VGSVLGVRVAARPHIDPRRVGVSPGAPAGAKEPDPPAPKAPLGVPLSARDCGLRHPGLTVPDRCAATIMEPGGLSPSPLALAA
jgi:hypothetical protein